MAAPKTPVVETGAGRMASGDSARAALINPVSQFEATQRLRGGGVGAAFEGLAKLTAGVAGMLKKQDVDRDQIMAVDLEGRVMRANDEEIAKLDPMAPDYHKQVTDIIKRNADAALADARFRTREVQDETARRFARIGAAVELTAVDARRKSIAAEAERVYNDRLEKLFADIRKDPAGAEVHMEAFQADAARLRSGISPDRLRIISHAAADGMMVAKIEGYVDKGDLASAKKFLSEAGLSQAQVRSLNGYIRSKEAEFRGNMERARAQHESDLRVSLSERLRSDSPNFAGERERIETLAKEGKISPSARATLIEAVYSAEDRKTRVDRAISIAVEKFRSGRGAGMSETETDLAWGAFTRDREVTPALVADFASEAGKLPTPIADLLATANASGKPGDPRSEEQLVRAATFFSSLSDSVPNVMRKVEAPRLEAVVERAKRNGGTPEAYQEAAKYVLAQTPQTERDHKDRGAVFDALTKPGMFSDLVRTVPEFKTSFFDKNAVIPAEVAAELRRLTKDAFVQTNDMASAQEIAKKQILKTFAVTRVGDAAYVTRNPIELAFPADYRSVSPEDRATIINREVKAELDRAGLATEAGDHGPGWKLEYVGVRARKDGTQAPAWRVLRWAPGDVAYQSVLRPDKTPFLIFPPREGTATNNPLVKDKIERNRAEEEARRSAREAREKLQRKR